MRANKTRTVGILLYEGFDPIDVTGPYDALSFAPDGMFAAFTVARSRGVVRAHHGLGMMAEEDFTTERPIDILLVPGSSTDVIARTRGEEDLIAWTKARGAEAEIVLSICTGAGLVAKAGLLDGIAATTHWAYTHLLPRVGATHEAARVVEDGNVVTSGGVTSGLDFALTLIGRLRGPATAQAIQLAIEYDPAPPYAGGHPDRTPEAVTEGLKARVYDAAAARMEAALTS